MTKPFFFKSSLTGVRILLVESDLAFQELLTIFLTLQRAEVSAVALLEEALQQLEHSFPDVILCALNPKSNACGFLYKWRQYEREQKLAPIPAIALSSLVAEQYESLALEAGFQVYMSKPFDVKTFMQIIADLVGSKWNNQQILYAS